jgi:DNA invertase Pin-like site-specific DNA recombinase
MTVAGYVRVSTEQQRDEGSHETQREQLEEWADRHGHDLELFEDIAVSGQSDSRPDYDAMMSRLDEFDIVAVRELSRFGRSLQQVLKDIERLDEHDVSFESVTEDFSTDSAMGTAMLQMIGVFNEFWANLARERAIENVQRRRENGEPIGRPKTVNDEQLEKVYEWHEAGLSYDDITRMLEVRYDVTVDRSTVWRYVNE